MKRTPSRPPERAETIRRVVDEELDRLAADDDDELVRRLGRDPALADEVRAGRALRAELAALSAPPPDPAFTETVMRALPDRVPHAGGFWRWLTRPVNLRVSPALMLGGLAVMLVTVAWSLKRPARVVAGSEPRHGSVERAPVAAASPGAFGDRAAAGDGATVPNEPGVIEVRFVLSAPGAKQVALIGDFNAWGAQALELEDRDGDGVFSLTVPLTPGRYAYQFLVDGDRFTIDPSADSAEPDGFGGQNSILRL